MAESLKTASKEAEYERVKNRLRQLEEMLVAHHLDVDAALSSLVRILCVRIRQEAHILQPSSSGLTGGVDIASARGRK